MDAGDGAGAAGGGVVNPVQVIPSHQRVGATCHGSGYQPGGGALGAAGEPVDCTLRFSTGCAPYLR